MQWDSGRNAGFSTGEPWLPIAQDYQHVNVAVERDDSRSMLSLYRRLIELRRASPALSVGAYARVHVDDDVLVYQRSVDNEQCVVALNLSHAARTVTLPERGRIVLSTHLERDGEVGDSLELRPDEGVVIG